MKGSVERWDSHEHLRQYTGRLPIGCRDFETKHRLHRKPLTTMADEEGKCAGNTYTASGVKRKIILEPPKEFDIVMGRGKRINNHTGNIHFRKLAREYIEEFAKSESITGKKNEVARKLVKKVDTLGGRFLRHVTAFTASGEHMNGWEVIEGDVVFTKARRTLRHTASSVLKKQSPDCTSPAKKAKRSVDAGCDQPCCDFLLRNQLGKCKKFTL